MEEARTDDGLAKLTAEGTAEVDLSIGEDSPSAAEKETTIESRGFGYGHSKRQRDDGDRPTDAPPVVAAPVPACPPMKQRRKEVPEIIKIEIDDDDTDDEEDIVEEQCMDGAVAEAIEGNQPAASGDLVERIDLLPLCWRSALLSLVEKAESSSEESRLLQKADHEFLEAWDQELRERENRLVSGDGDETRDSSGSADGAEISAAQASAQLVQPKPSQRSAPSVAPARVKTPCAGRRHESPYQ